MRYYSERNYFAKLPSSQQLISFQVSAASENEVDEAVYQYYRQRALVRPHWLYLEQNITGTRRSRSIFSSSIGESDGCVHLDFAPAHFVALEFRLGEKAPSTPALNSSQSCFGANFQSRFPPSNFPGL